MTQLMDKVEIKSAILGKLERHFGKGIADATPEQIYEALAYTVRDEIMERRTRSRGERRRQDAKKVYYLSAEFLVGRSLHNNIVTLVNEKAYAEALHELGIDRTQIFEQELEPGLGNGGLGRLAACFLDSLSALKLSAMGMTIRYEYGLFRQHLADGFQVELPDNWLANANIWEINRSEDAVEVHFGGEVEQFTKSGREHYRTAGSSAVLAIPYDIPVLGYDSDMVNMLRTWSARSANVLDMQKFSQGEYAQALEERQLAEVISKVLYPGDNHESGKELRLKQQYFLASASVQYIVKRFEQDYGARWSIFPEKVVMHVNDTHPGLAIPELMRILIDEKGLSWDEAAAITHRSFAFTNHTVMQEAFERWPEDMIRRLIPRVYMILEELNRRLGSELWNAYPGQWEKIAGMSIIAYGYVHMANLCVALSYCVNGVSQIHTDILRRRTFHDYCVIHPERFISITNGVTHRRWLMQCNPGLAALMDEAIGEGWRKEPEQFALLAPFAGDAGFREQFDQVKQNNKLHLARYLERTQGIRIDPDTIFDTQAKRLHEYKRQLMNALSILMLYNNIADDPNFVTQPRTFLFGAKASPDYLRAKLIIKLINNIGDLIEKHPRARTMLKIAFVENYSVSMAEALIPATDVSEQISTAGKEASGTGNMKFMMNGALTLGTMDGANIEIYEAVGPENIYIFGLSAEEVERAYEQGTYRARDVYDDNADVRRALDQLASGAVCPDNPRLFQDLYHSLLFEDGGGMADPYFVLKDLPGYHRVRGSMAQDYEDRALWLTKAVLNTARSGIFSSDRSITEYNEKIWHSRPLVL